MAFNWLDGGVGSVALVDNLMKTLVAKGALSHAEHSQIIDSAIADLENSGNPDLAKAASSLRSLFNR